MKPTKNHHFCIGCKRNKILFESKAKADNFIKFNRDEIDQQNGKAPSRSYYCSFCCGWHVTSITNIDIAVARDNHDANIWEDIRQNTSLKKKQQKTKKFPKTEQGEVLRSIAMRIDQSVSQIETALGSADIHLLRTELDNLLNLEKELRIMSEQYGIHVTSIDKRYEKIAKTKELFSSVFDYFVDKEKRQKYLASMSDENGYTKEYIIINNIEIADRINSCLVQIDSLSTTTEQDKIKTICNDITTNLILKLKGNTKRLKHNVNQRIEKILTRLSYHKQIENSYYRGLILSIINHLEKAHLSYIQNDFQSCEASLKIAETLIPDPSNNIERELHNQVLKLRSLLN